MQIIELINKIKSEAGALAPAKTSGVPFPFRGIDGTINHLSQHLTNEGVIVVPHVVEYERDQRENAKKQIVTSAKVLVDFTFYAPDGSSVVARTAGYADDFADRAAAQAQSVAFRVALLQTFMLPTQQPEPEQTGQAVQDGDVARRVHEPAAAKKAPVRQVNQGGGDLKAKVRELISSKPEGERDEFRTYVNDQWAAIAEKMKKPKGDDAVLTKLISTVESGEVV